MKDRQKCGGVSVENFVHVFFRGHQRSKQCGGVFGGAELPPFFC
jgi:hypothetical protein